MSTIKVDTVTTLDGTGNITLSRPLTGLSGSGASLTALNATELTSGTLPMARLSGTLPALNGSALTNLDAADVSGTHTNFTSTGIDDNATSTAMTIIASGGNVGIGTTSPASLLSVKGTLQIDHTTNASYYGTIRSAGDLRIEAASSRAIDFVTGGSVRLRVHGSGGICFNGDTATANALDDYEEGSWTPQLTDGTNTNATAAGNNTGQYVKIGKVVFISCTVSTSAIGSLSGQIWCDGLPFTVYSGGGLGFAVMAGSGGGMGLTAGHNMSGNFNGATTKIAIYVWDVSTGTSGMQASEWGGGNTQMTFAGHYWI